MSHQESPAPMDRRLAIEMAVVMCCKIAVILGLGYFFFGPDQRLEQTPENVAAGLLGTAERPATSLSPTGDTQ